MISGKYITEITLTGITAVIVGLTLLFNDINIQIRIKEIKVFLQRSNRDDNSIDHIGLVMKYRLHKKMYDSGISGEDSGIIEARVNSILSSREERSMVLPGRYRFMSVPVVFSINMIRRIIGLPLIEDINEEYVNLNLEVAYYYERNKDYKKAISVYEKILNDPSTGRALSASVLLHLGFCYSILGDYNLARLKYLTVIKEYGELSTAVTAAVMLRYLEGFRTEIERVLKTEKDSTEKGEKLYKLIAYTESYEVLRRVEKTASPSERDKIKFYKGRTLEELGESGKAVETYQQIIMDDPKSKYAQYSNRRIYLVGSVNIEGDKIKKLSMENNRLINDEILIKMADEDSKYHRKIEKSGNVEFTRGLNNSLAEKIENGDTKSVITEDSIDRMIKNVEVKVNGKRSITEKVSLNQEMRLKIFTNDGNIFIGTLKKETSDEIIIRSSIGDIKISKSRVSRRINL